MAGINNSGKVIRLDMYPITLFYQHAEVHLALDLARVTHAESNISDNTEYVTNNVK